MLTKEELAQKSQDYSKLVGEADAIIKEFQGKAMPETKASELDTKCKEAEALKVELDAHEAEVKVEGDRLSRIDALKKFRDDPLRKVPFDAKLVNPLVDKGVDFGDEDPVIGYMTLGKAYALSQSYQAGHRKGFAGAADFPAKLKVTPDGRHVAIRMSEYKAFKDMGIETKDIYGTTVGDLVMAYRLPELVGDLHRPLRIRNLMTVAPSTSSTLEYVETTFAQAAAETAQKTAKPKSDMTAELKTEAAKTIAHYVRVSNQMLKDYSQLSTKIDTELVYGLDLREDYQLLWGDGTGANLTGILNRSGILDYDSAIGAVRGLAGDTLVDKIRRAMSNVAVEYLAADGVTIHPFDWEEIELLKGSDDHYIWVSVNDGGAQRVWRVPVVESVSCQNPSDSDERHCVVGAFKIGCGLFDVDDAQVEIGYAGDDFIENMKRVRAEKRVIFACYYPQGFVDIETASSAS